MGDLLVPICIPILFLQEIVLQFASPCQPKFVKRILIGWLDVSRMYTSSGPMCHTILTSYQCRYCTAIGKPRTKQKQKAHRSCVSWMCCVSMSLIWVKCIVLGYLAFSRLGANDHWNNVWGKLLCQTYVFFSKPETFIIHFHVVWGW